MKLFQRGPNGPFVDQAAHAGSHRAARRPQPAADRLQQRRLQGRARPARRVGAGAAEVAAAQQLRRHVHRRDLRQRPGQAGDEHADRRVDRHRQRRMASICSSATKTRRRSCFAIAATARSRTSPGPPAWRGPHSPKPCHAGDFDNDGVSGPLRLESPRRRTSSIATTTTGRSPRSARRQA